MSVVQCYECGGGRGGDKNQRYARNYTRCWKLITDDPHDSVDTILDYTAKIPALWSAHPANSLALCLDVQAVNTAEDGDARHWEATAKYSTDYGLPETPNPLDRKIKRSVRYNHYKRVMTEDINGIAVVNPAGDKPQDPAEIDAIRPVFVFQRNESFINVSRVIDFCYAINVADFMGCAKRTLRALITIGEEQTQNGIQFWPVLYELEYRPETWRYSYLAEGYNAYVKRDDGTYQKIPVAGGAPRLLAPRDRAANPDGQFRKNAAEAIFVSESDDPFYCKRDAYKERPFADLGLGV